MKKLGIDETKEMLDLLKNERKTQEFLHSMYLSTVRGGIIEFFGLSLTDGMWGLTGAWCDMQMYITDLNDLEMITDDEYTELLIFVNDTYLKSCDKLQKKGGKPNGKSERRCDVNSRCNTSRNGRRTSETDGNNNDE